MKSPSSAALRPLDDDERDALERLLHELPAPLEPLDISALDGYLCGVLLQPQTVPAEHWQRFMLDDQGREPIAPTPPRLLDLALRRHAELRGAINARQWFDPWVFELEDDASPALCVSPWVAGFSLATEVFPQLTRLDSPALTEPLALLYRHLDPEDLEDVDEALAAEIESYEPAATLEEAVEDLVRATLLLADIVRPLPAPARQRPVGSRRR